MRVTIAELLVADPPEAWEAAGFTVGPGAVCRVGEVAIRLVGRETGVGIVGWALDGVPDGDLDGVPTRAAAPRASTEPEPAPAHPNGVVGIDHVVLLSPDLERTKTVLGDAGLDLRRERDGELGGMPITQAFYRLGEVILEVVGLPGQASDEPSDEPSSLWGLTHVVADIDAAAAALGERTGRVKDAVQPGRRITTLRHRDLGMSVRTALITPHVRGSEAG